MKQHSQIGLVTNSSSEVFSFRRDFDFDAHLRVAYATYVLECHPGDRITEFLEEHPIERRDLEDYGWGASRPDYSVERPEDRMEVDAGDNGCEFGDYEFISWLRGQGTRFGFHYGRVD